jgi:hypothetical protein
MLLKQLYFTVQFSKNILKNIMVGLNGLEPSTSALSEQRSNQLSYRPTYGGDKGNRTLDPLRARQVLSQLSYIPIYGILFYEKLFGLSKLNRGIGYVNYDRCFEE